jgi:hypothetical protein
MTTMLLLDDVPVAFVGARRWYPTQYFDELDADDRDAITAIAHAMIAKYVPPPEPSANGSGPAG